MKKFLALLFAALLMTALVACAGNEEESKSESQSESQSEQTATIMTHAEYVAAADNDPVVIEAYVQAKQAWWDNKATLYLADEDGAYFAYNTVCSESDYALLVPGTKIKVTGFKTSWGGEVEIDAGATFTIEEGSYIAPAFDVTALLGTDDLIKHQNEFVSFKGMTVVASESTSGEDVAFLYKGDVEGDDLYFKVSLDGNVYDFVVESYLCDKTTDVYKAVTSLAIGDVIDLEGFLYWYNGVNPHITSVTKVAAD